MRAAALALWNELMSLTVSLNITGGNCGAQRPLYIQNCYIWIVYLFKLHQKLQGHEKHIMRFPFTSRAVGYFSLTHGHKGVHRFHITVYSSTGTFILQSSITGGDGGISGRASQQGAGDGRNLISPALEKLENEIACGWRSIWNDNNDLSHP